MIRELEEELDLKVTADDLVYRCNVAAEVVKYTVDTAVFSLLRYVDQKLIVNCEPEKHPKMILVPVDQLQDFIKEEPCSYGLISTVNEVYPLAASIMLHKARALDEILAANQQQTDLLKIIIEQGKALQELLDTPTE